MQILSQTRRAAWQRAAMHAGGLGFAFSLLAAAAQGS
jgi:hypothetical protein